MKKENITINKSIINKIGGNNFEYLFINLFLNSSSFMTIYLKLVERTPKLEHSQTSLLMKLRKVSLRNHTFNFHFQLTTNNVSMPVYIII